MTGTFWVYAHQHQSFETNRKSGWVCDINNTSPRLETQDSEHISQRYFPSLFGSRLLFLWAFLHFSCFQPFGCTDRVSKEAATEHNWLHQRDAEGSEVPAAAAVTTMWQQSHWSNLMSSAEPMAQLVHDLWEVHDSSQHNTHTCWDIMGGSGRIPKQAMREWDLWTGEKLFLGMGGGTTEAVSTALSSSTVSAALGSQGNTPCNTAGPSKKPWCSSCSTNSTNCQGRESDQAHQPILPLLNVKYWQVHPRII